MTDVTPREYPPGMYVDGHPRYVLGGMDELIRYPYGVPAAVGPLTRLVPLPDREALAEHLLDVGARIGVQRTWWECTCGYRLTEPAAPSTAGDDLDIPGASELHLVHLFALLSGDTR